jgi:hypothetical protein
MAGRGFGGLGKALLVVPLALGLFWASLALWIDAPLPKPLRAVVAGGFGVGALLLLIRVRPFVRGVVMAGLLFLGVATWWAFIPPSNDRDWLPDVARLPHAEIDGDRVVIHNVRNFHYRSELDFDERWETRELDLSQLEGVDFYFSFWGPTWIAHTIASWQFADGPPLAVSIETRKERGEAYSAVLGFFRQFELYYVVADERDVVQVRTNHRGEQVFLYRLRASPERARAILLQYLSEINRLAERPRWYNALTHNCTTEIRHNTQQVASGNPFSWKMLANGFLDELGYERGSISTALPFEEMRARSDITERARAADGTPDFSRRIREGLPPRPPRRSDAP